MLFWLSYVAVQSFLHNCFPSSQFCKLMLFRAQRDHDGVSCVDLYITCIVSFKYNVDKTKSG